MNISTTSAAAASAAPSSRQEPTSSDCQILTSLGHRWQDMAFPYRKRCFRAARRIFNKAQQWPWEWAADILPHKAWGYHLLEDIARILDELEKRSTKANRHSNAYNLREFLRKRARERNESDPHLTTSDVREAMEHFGVKGKARKTADTANETELGGDEGKAEDRQSVNNGSTGENGSQQGGTQNELDAAGFTSPVTTGNRKRPGEASDNSQTKKSARRDEPGNHGEPALGSPGPTIPQTEGLINLVKRVHGEKPLAPFLLNIVSTIQDQKAATQMTLNGLEDQLSAARFSMKAREASLNGLALHGVTPQMLEELRWTLSNTTETKKETEKAKAFFERHQAEMALDPILASQVTEQYETKLRECDEGIARAEAKLRGMEEAYIANSQEWEKLQGQLHQDKERVRHLEVSHEHFTLQLEYYRTIGDLMKLGAYGMASVTKKLAESGIPLFTVTKDPEVKSEPSVYTAP